MLLPKPKELSWVQAAGIPENWMTGRSFAQVVCGMMSNTHFACSIPSSVPGGRHEERPERSHSCGRSRETLEYRLYSDLTQGASGVGVAAIQLARELVANEV
jgi:hypothetical protein